MNILVTGKGGDAGSWKCRGEQLGEALGATVKPMAAVSDCLNCDLAIVVKRTPHAVMQALRTTHKRWVFDAVDFYPQPCDWERDEAIRWVKRCIGELNPTAVIWPNRRMREDCDDGRPGIVLKHHHRPGIRRNPIREEIAAVGYEGDPRYLADWHTILAGECRKRGWQFVVNPANLADVDVVVAFRGGQFAGYVPKHWKSNVKLANAHGSGTPFIGQRECGYVETASGCEYWADNTKSLRTSFDWLLAQSTRELVHDRFVQAAYPVEKAAADLGAFLRAL